MVSCAHRSVKPATKARPAKNRHFWSSPGMVSGSRPPQTRTYSTAPKTAPMIGRKLPASTVTILLLSLSTTRGDAVRRQVEVDRADRQVIQQAAAQLRH